MVGIYCCSKCLLQPLGCHNNSLKKSSDIPLLSQKSFSITLELNWSLLAQSLASFTLLLVIHFSAIVIIYLLIYILVYCCIIGQQDSLSCSLDYLTCTSIFCLVSGRYNTLLQVHLTLATYPYQQDSYSSHFPLPTSTYRGSIFHYITFYLNPPRVTGIPPCVRFLLH